MNPSDPYSSMVNAGLAGLYDSQSLNTASPAVGWLKHRWCAPITKCERSLGDRRMTLHGGKLQDTWCSSWQVTFCLRA